MRIKFSILFFTVFFTFLSAQEPKEYETEIYKNRMLQFVEEGLKQDQIIFLGNSLTQGGKWEIYFPKQKPINRGIVGDNTEGILARIDDIAVSKPSKLFLLMGINDISQNRNNDYICENIRKIVAAVHDKSPETVIYLQSVLPINNDFGRYKRLIGKEKQIENLNRKLKKYCKKGNVDFVNLYPSFLLKRRLLDPKYTNDGLHLNDVGYEIWVEKIRKLVEE